LITHLSVPKLILVALIQKFWQLAKTVVAKLVAIHVFGVALVLVLALPGFIVAKV
jgi:hypothetical protein